MFVQDRVHRGVLSRRGKPVFKVRDVALPPPHFVHHFSPTLFFKLSDDRSSFVHLHTMFHSQISAGATLTFLLITIILLVSPRGESSKGAIEAEISVRLPPPPALHPSFAHHHPSSTKMHKKEKHLWPTQSHLVVEFFFGFFLPPLTPKHTLFAQYSVRVMMTPSLNAR